MVTPKTTEPIVAIFRRLDELPPCREPGVPWVAEMYIEDSELPFPVAIAYMSDYRGLLSDTMVLDFIIVPDQYRRQGYALALVRECYRHFNGRLILTDAISPEGEALIAAVEREQGD